eukprot:TRINITY_DN36419_c0_g1_i1.p1 TRINITY_DN36419_c0_g1~~TRINITY_DN36419_c0_g1_i1.p1  ORF type:complete len:572 (-),score=215.13 TRINITY_DN36419_c0_g1_i1:245-1960(-)
MAPPSRWLPVSLFFFFFKQKTAYEMLRSLVGSEMCIRDSSQSINFLKKAIVANDGVNQKDWRARASQLALQRDVDGLKGVFQERCNSADKDLLDAKVIVANLDSHPELLPVAFNLATILAAKSSESDIAATSHATAQRLLIAIVKRFPQMKEAYHLLADIALSHRQFTQAQKWLALCLSVFPADSMALTTLSKMCVDVDAPKVAEEVLKRANNTCPSATLARGALYLKSSQVPSDKAPELLMAAKDCFTSVLRRDPANVLAAHGVACCVSAGGGNISKRIRMPAAEQCLYQVGSLLLNDPSIAAGSTYNQVNHMVRTRACTSGIVLLTRYEESLTVAQRVALAFCYASQRDFTGAIQALDKAIEMKPEDQGLRYNRLVLLFGSIAFDLGSKKISDVVADDIRSRLESASTLAMSFVNRISTEGDGILGITLQTAQTNIRRIARELHNMDEALIKAANRHQLSKEELIRERDMWRQRAAAIRDEEERARREKALHDEIEDRRRREIHDSWAAKNKELVEGSFSQPTENHVPMPDFGGGNDDIYDAIDPNAELVNALGDAEVGDVDTQLLSSA